MTLPTMRSHPLYETWRSMIKRCRANNKDARHYAARGIKVCQRWLGREGFWNFVADMEQKPTPDHELDRRDNSKGYDPENCHWVTKRRQRSNRDFVHKLNGKTAKEIEEETGLPFRRIRWRIKHGWPSMDITTERTFHGKERAGAR